MKKKDSTMDFILAILAITVYGFTAVMIWVYILTGNVPDSLVYAFFAAITGEAGFMGWIKTSKQKHREREWELEDRELQLQAEREKFEKEKKESQMIVNDKNHQGDKL